MKKSMLILGLLSAMSVIAVAQGPVKPRQLSPKSAQLDTTPVTQAEARAVVKKMEGYLSHGLHLSAIESKIAIPDSKSPVTRPQVVHEFDRLFVQYKPAFKFTPPKVKFDASQITLKDPVEKPALLKLIAWGTIAKIGPIAANRSSTLTVHEFGDAVGFFMSRIADLSHTPPSKWTPYLNGGRS